MSLKEKTHLNHAVFCIKMYTKSTWPVLRIQRRKRRVLCVVSYGTIQKYAEMTAILCKRLQFKYAGTVLEILMGSLIIPSGTLEEAGDFCRCGLGEVSTTVVQFVRF